MTKSDVKGVSLGSNRFSARIPPFCGIMEATKRGHIMNSFERRIRAISIDLSFATIVFILLSFAVSLFPALSDASKASIAAGVAYFGVMLVPHFFSRGQSFGKRNQKLRIVHSRTGRIPPLAVLLARDFLKGFLMIFTFGAYIILCGIALSIRKDGRLPHDWIFLTKVECITRYVSDKEGSVLEISEAMKKRLEGSGHD